ncbi:MAG: ABC-type transport auxiliary lipoprotein family protein [Novosphingobium sp.]|nr:membrane integrity-associated transporter subunit PqiC [Novosphingobium sp.]
MRKRNVKAMVTKAAALAAVMLLAGCISFSKKPPDTLISLTPESTAPIGNLGTGALDNAILVLDPDADRRLDVQRVPVQVDTSTVAYLKDASWIERPARQFRRLLAETIRAKSGRLVIESNDVEVSSKLVLSGRLTDMGYYSGSQSVVVRYDALLESDDGTIRSRRFEAIVPGVAPSARAVAPALNEAANDVATQVADWVG